MICLCSLTLECLKGFLLSKILQKMSEDVNAASATTQEEEGMIKSLSMSTLTTGGTLHLSRSDMFNMLRDQALTTLCRYLRTYLPHFILPHRNIVHNELLIEIFT